MTDPRTPILCGAVMATCRNEPGHPGDHWCPDYMPPSQAVALSGRSTVASEPQRPDLGAIIREAFDLYQDHDGYISTDLVTDYLERAGVHLGDEGRDVARSTESPESIGAIARRCDEDHCCDDCGELWRVSHHCRFGTALCGGHGRPNEYQRLRAERDRLIADGVNPADLEPLVASPETPEAAAGVHLGDEGLDAAWARAEAALPGWIAAQKESEPDGDWEGAEKDYTIRVEGNAWGATAWLVDTSLSDISGVIEVEAPTPSAALNALTARLTEGDSR